MPALTVALTLFALLGHAALCVGYVNRIHATGLHRRVIKLKSALGHAALVLPPFIGATLWWTSGISLTGWLTQAAGQPLLRIYLVACWIIAASTIVQWIGRWLTLQPKSVLSAHSTVVDVAARLGYKPIEGSLPRLLSLVPGNQVLRVSIDELQLGLPRLPARLDGLSITHLSDLHITGRVGIGFFQEVVSQANALRSDIIVVTGDIIDELSLLDWIPDALAQLSAPLGVYFVLGNHDQFTGEAPRIRRQLADSGFMDVGNSWQRVELGGAEIIVAGNELPWFGSEVDLTQCPPRSSSDLQFRLLLSHSPDQFAWASDHDFDLMLAGHAHGGQIRLPLVGPIFCPSRYGVKYACGTFYRNPTLMHVSRGISSELPLRLNCPPEITKIVLHPSAAVK